MDDHNREILAAHREENLRRYDEAMRENGTGHLARQAIAECALCDDEGYRPNLAVCDHKDRRDVGRSQREQIRKMLTKGNR